MGKSKNRSQVFINFRGKDERQKLLPHLKQHLKDRNVNVFTDEDAFAEPKRKLFKHIRRSRIVIVIFSINYLESEWCLDELVEIRKCLQTEKLDFAIPIFYKVKTSHVKKLSGKFGKKFVALQKKHRKSKVKRWKKALRYVADIVGLTYQKRSSISELDFIKMIVEKVDFTLTKISKKNNSSETSEGESSNQTDLHHLNKMIHYSTTSEAVNQERSYLQGWKDGIISSMQSSSNSFRSSHPANPLQFRGYNWGVNSRPVLSPNFAPFVEVPTCYRLLEPKVPQDYRPSISYHNNINQYHPWYSHSTLSEPQVPQAVNRERSYLQGVMFGWKDGIISSMQSSSNSFTSSHPANRRQYMSYNWGVDSPRLISIVKGPTRSMLLVQPWYSHSTLSEPHVPQDYRRSFSNISSYNSMCEDMCEDAESEDITNFSSLVFDEDHTIHPTSLHYDIVSTSHAAEQDDKTSCISFLCNCFKRCFSLIWGAKEDDVD